ncbi:MAG: penicillin-binding protein [Lachnospiraceae bacterium]|nr:penicillin-binding protein [Lachnospiraceae bacterium]
MYQEIKDYILSILRSRLFPVVTLFIILFIILIHRLFDLQIIQGEAYVESMNVKTEEVQSITATRGNIYDCNGVLLAYNDLAFAVKISDSGKYSSVSEKNKILNQVIADAVTILLRHGENVNCDYPIILNEDGHYEFNVSDSAKQRFLRDAYGHRSISELTPEELNASASDVIDFVCEKTYQINQKNKDGEIEQFYEPEMVLYILNYRSYMSANSYQRSTQFTMASDVSDESVAEILENSQDLIGVDVCEEYIRKYVDGFYVAHILGYTGMISSDELEVLQEEDSQYTASDIVGKSGIEQSMEQYLQGTKGSRKVYVDHVGRITEVLEEKDPIMGSDVYLTIDIELQKKVYKALEQQIADILVSHIVDSDEQYVYKSDGTTISTINIPIKDVYFALIDNNVISMSEIASCKTATESTVYHSFLDKQKEVLDRLSTELLVSDTDYAHLSEEMQNYIYTIYEILGANGVLLRSNIDTSDTVYEEWIAETISFKEFLSYALAKNWIDVSKFTDSNYTSLSESYEALVAYILEDVKKESSFSKKIYKYMIKYRSLSGSQLGVLLYDQGILKYDEETYGKLIMGSTSAYSFMVNKIAACEITPAMLALKPCSGSATIIDNDTGRILAMVSYPSYDINYFSGSVDAAYYNQLLNDKSLPLVNNATTTRTAPGSSFKMVSAVAGLEEGIITASEIIECNGIYETVTPNPKCWVYPSRHGNENVKTALRDSCNVYFYEVGYRLATNNMTEKYDSNRATDILADYAKRMGLAVTTGIEIYEQTPIASNENAVASAIGQGRNSYTGLNLCHYVSTIANSGVCYDLTLIDRVVDSSGTVIFESIPIISSTMNDVSSSTWNTVHEGMRMVSENTSSLITNTTVSTASKTGTAQENTKLPDHCDFICYAPYENPEIGLSIVIQNGYTSGNAAKVAANILNIYYGLSNPSEVTTKNSETEGTVTEGAVAQ